MSGPDRDFLEAVLREVQRARAKFPGNTHRLAALTEETGEAARALLDGEPHPRVAAECVQVAAMALRLAVEGDRDFGAPERGSVVATKGPFVLVEYPEENPWGGPVRKWEVRGG